MPHRLANPDHPVWSIFHLMVVGLLITLFAYLNASNFDETELKMILEILLALAGYNGITKILKERTKGKADKGTDKEVPKETHPN